MSLAAGFHPKQILCPIDMSPLSDLALKYAHVGAQVFGARLTVLNAMLFEYPRYLSKELTDQVLRELNRAKADARDQLAGHVAKVLGHGARKAEIDYRTVDIDAAQAILQAVEEIRADLVVMGTHGYSGFKHWMLGSVTEKVLHLSKAPVFTIRQKIDDFIDPDKPDARPAIKQILCPCNFSPAAAAALQTAVALAQRMNARLAVMHSEESPSADGPQRLREWIKKSGVDNTAIHTILRQGDAADQTIVAARELGSDLIVIGSCHRPFGEGTVVGRTSERVARHATVPVLTVPYFEP
ncbi:MAG: universal stress protein [Desulfobacteraceae bacterium]|nr:universal stress protein [Desulfobacteraceae bacterium]